MTEELEDDAVSETVVKKTRVVKHGPTIPWKELAIFFAGIILGMFASG